MPPRANVPTLCPCSGEAYTDVRTQNDVSTGETTYVGHKGSLPSPQIMQAFENLRLTKKIAGVSG